MLILLIFAALLAIFLPPLFAPKTAPAVQAGVIGMTPTPSASDYARVTGPQKLSFPQDMGPHPDYLTEWWYYTGNLAAADGRRFGFQLTFFRRAIDPPGDRVKRPSDWAANQVYMAHFTLTDVSAKQFHAFERFERGAAGLAGATISGSPPAFQVWLHDWAVTQTGANTYRLQAKENGVALSLDFTDTKGFILQGDQGYSAKGPQTGNASLYFSQTHLETRGTVTVGGAETAVTGLSWMDREISTSALSTNEVGWDWFALQLSDGSELMAYVLRRSDGSIDPFSSGTYIAPDGSARHLTRKDFQITPQATWKSPHSGGVYPAKWKVSVPSAGIDLEVQPLLADQELNLSFTYWEGAVSFSGTHSGKAVTGHGYVELTGYAKALQGL